MFLSDLQNIFSAYAKAATPENNQILVTLNETILGLCEKAEQSYEELKKLYSEAKIEILNHKD